MEPGTTQRITPRIQDMSRHGMERAARGFLLAALFGAAGAAAAAEYVNGARVDGAEPGEWTHDWDAATAAAKKDGKPVFVNVTGSDWCGWCKLLKRQVFTQPEWGAWASNHVYLVHLDFPNDKALVPEKYRERNRDLSRRYKVGGYPTCFLLDPATLKSLGTFGASRDANAADFIEKVSAKMPGTEAAPMVPSSASAPQRPERPGPTPKAGGSGDVEFDVQDGVLLRTKPNGAEIIVVPEGVRRTEYGSFWGQDLIRDVRLPVGLEVLGDRTFENCYSLERVFVPATVKKIGPGAFNGCRRLSRIDIQSGSKFEFKNGILFDREARSVLFALAGIERAVFPESVREIGRDAFMRCEKLEEVSIPEGVTTIGRSAFLGCKKLSVLRLPSTLEVLEDSAISDCPSLERIEIPAGGRYSVSGNTLLGDGGRTLVRGFGRVEEIRVSDGITRIAPNAFSNSGALKKAFVPDTVSDIGYSAFSYCPELEELRLPAKVLKCGSRIAEHCPKLRKLAMPEGVEEIHFTYWGCKALTELNIPKSVKIVGQQAIQDCDGLTEIVFPEGVREFRGNWTVSHCPNLVSIHLPSTVEKVKGWGVFGGNPKLKTIEVSPSNRFFASVDGVLFSKDMTRLVQCPGGRTGVYEIPGTVSEIDPFAFSGCKGLTEIRIPESVRVFGHAAFNDCPAKTNHVASAASNVKVAEPPPQLRRPSPPSPAPPPATPGAERPAPPTGTVGAREPEFVIEYGILRGVKPNGEAEAVVPAETRVAYIDRIRNVRRIVLSEGIESIRRGGMDLDSRATLESVSIPKSVREIQPGVFNGSFRKLSSIEIAHGSPFSMDGGCLVDKREGTLLFALPGRERIIVPNGVRTIADHALDGNGDVREVILPEGVRTIGRSAFAWCTALEFVAIPSSLREIGSDAFNHCRALSKLRIPDSVTAIGRGAFEDCPARTIRVHAIDLSTAPSRAADPPAAKDRGGLVAAEMPLLKFPREGLVAEFVFNDENKARDLAKEGRTFKLRRAASGRPVELDSLVTNGALRLTGDYFGKEANITHLDVPELRYDRFTVATSFRPERDPEKSTPLVSFGGGWRWFHILLRGDGTPLVQFRGLAKGELSFPLSEPLRQDEWNWLAVSFDASRRRVSVVLNGKRIPDIVLPEDFAFRLDRQDRDQSRTVQFANTNNGTVFKGAIKSFLLFDRAFTDAEIESIAVSSAEPPTQWTFLPGDGEDAFWNGRVSDGSVRLPARVANGAAAVGFPDRLDPPNGLLDLSKPVVDASGNTVPLVGIGQKEKRSPSANSGIPKGVTEVRLPETLRWIGPGAFQGFRSLRTLRIPASVKRIGAAAFADCPALERIEFEDASFRLDDRVFGIPRKGETTHRPTTNLPKE